MPRKIRKIPRKVKVQIDEDILLIINSKKQNVNETYSDVLRRLIVKRIHIQAPITAQEKPTKVI